MTTMKVDEHVFLNFVWKGSNFASEPTTGRLHILAINLLFNDVLAQISVPLGDKLPPDTYKKCAFICRQFGEEIDIDGQIVRPMIKQATSPSLKLTIKQIQQLIVIADFIEKKEEKSSGQTAQPSICKSTEVIKLALPEELKPGQTYCLEMTAEKLSLSARVIQELNEGEKKVKNEGTKEAGSHLTKNRELLLNVLYNQLGPLIEMVLHVEDKEKVRDAIKKEVGKITDTSLTELNEDLSKLSGEKAEAMRFSLEEILKKSFTAIGGYRSLFDILASFFIPPHFEMCASLQRRLLQNGTFRDAWIELEKIMKQILSKSKT